MNKTIISLDSLRQKGANRLKTIQHTESLTDVEVPNNHVALLIIPSFHNKRQDNSSEFLNEQALIKIFSNPQERGRWDDYSQVVQETGHLIDSIAPQINRFFVCQNYSFEEEWLNDLKFTYELLIDCQTFPREYPKSIHRLWYHRKGNGHIELITPVIDFVDLCKEREAKFNVLFMHAKHSAWLKNFFANYEKKVLHILPDIHLLLIKIK